VLGEPCGLILLRIPGLDECLPGRGCHLSSGVVLAPTPQFSGDQSGGSLLVQRANAIPGRGGYSVEAVDVWSKQATAHAAYATVDTSVMNLWVAATRRQGDLEVSK
jgi:hypothetical protein